VPECCNGASCETLCAIELESSTFGHTILMDSYSKVCCRGNTDMLLLLLNDDKNCVIRQGIEIINSRGHVGEGKEDSQDQ
jgi:hypothetical protein